MCDALLAVFFEYLPKRTISAKGERTVWVRCGGRSKERATLMLLGDSNGVKATPFVVFKTARSKSDARHDENVKDRHGFGRSLWRELAAEQRDLCIFGNAKGIV